MKISPEQIIPNPDNKKPEHKFPDQKEYVGRMKENGLEKHAQAYEKVCDLCHEIRDLGGQALLVGGSVRDYFMGITPKDFDLEVYGLEPEKIEAVLKRFGKNSEVGRSFGIMKIFLENGLDIDVSIPRTDSKNGEGHKGFDVKTDPYMSISEAARRRDFTMNTLSADPISGDVHDYFGGIHDIKNRILKVTDKERFKDDPLRVMRAMQFVGRFGMKIDSESETIMKELVSDIKELPEERFLEEWKKLLLKSDKPSLGLMTGMRLGVFDELHPEFPPLVNTPQEKNWHPEGDVWMHTLMSVDEAAKLCRQEKYGEKEAFNIILAALCHDLGKPETTVVGDKITSYGHDKAGESPTEKFLDTIGLAKKDAKKIIKLVSNHMAPTLLYINSLSKSGVSDGAIRRLADRIYPAIIPELVTVAHADHAGRGPFDAKQLNSEALDPTIYAPRQWLLQRAEELGVYDKKPEDLVRGRDLIEQGKSPGKQFGTIISLINEIRDIEDELREKINSEKIEKLSREEMLEIVAQINDPADSIDILNFVKKKTSEMLKKIN